MLNRQPPGHRAVPRIWLVADARNDPALERALRRLPRGSGLVFRHYHLDPERRRARFGQLARLAARRGVIVALAGPVSQARRWNAGAVYGPAARLSGSRLLKLATVHSMRELGAAHRADADAVMISPVFASRSHPGGAVLAPVRALLLARKSLVPAILLGGMTRRRAMALTGRARAHGWAAIDGLSS